MICSNDSDFIHANSGDLALSANTKILSDASRANTSSSSSSTSSASDELHHTNTTNSSSSTNSLAFTEEDDYEISSPSPVDSLPPQLSEKTVGTPTKRIQRRGSKSEENEIDCIKLKLMNISTKPQQSSQLFKKETSPTLSQSRFQTYSMLRASLSNLTSAFGGASSPQNLGTKSGDSLANANSLLVNETNKNSASSAASTSSSSSSSSSSQNQNKSSNEQDNQLKQISNFQAYQQNTKYIFILNAFVNGFAQLKLCADKIDYEYIIEIYWSNEARSFVKRTFEDFVSFHRKLMLTFSDIFNELNAVCPSASNNKKSITASSTSESSKTNQSSSQNNSSNQSSKSAPVKVNLNKYGITGKNDHLVPVLPAAKKPFWMSHLKLAESREIELNNYVQKLIKLPIKISHSPLVLQFFESQSSDPKPAKLNNRNSRVNSESNNNETSELGSDNSMGGENCDYDDDIDPDCSNSNGTDNENRVLDDDDDDELDDNSNFGDDDNEEDVDIDDEMNYNRTDSFNAYEDEDVNSNVANNYVAKISSSHLLSNLPNGNVKRIHRNNCHSATIGHGCGGVSSSGVPSVSSGRYRRRNNVEAGLWWDEDNALNELTTSASFDFSCSLAMNNGLCSNDNSTSSHHKLNDNLNEDDDDEELETLKTLESMLQNSDLFRSNETYENSSTSAPSVVVENQL